MTATLATLSQASDPKKAIIDGVGDLTGVIVMSGKVLLGIYIAPEKTKGGLYRAPVSIAEDVWQGTVGLVLKKGPLAFKDDETTKFHGQDVNEGDWVLFRPGDTARLQISGVNCRLIEDTLIQAILPDPEMLTHRIV